MTNLLAAYLHGRRRRRVENHLLQDMDDRLLADIGLTRRDIAAMIDGDTPAALKTRLQK